MESRAVRAARPRPSERSRHFALGLMGALSLLSSCSGPPSPQTAAPKSKGPPPTLTELLPLKDKTVSSFRTESDLGEQGILMLEIFRPRQDLAELSIAGRIQRLHVTPTRISHAAGGILLQEPLQTGATFHGSFGEVTITETNAPFTVPAGAFQGCLTTVEESSRPPKRATSVYCPLVGLTQMVLESFGEDSGRLETSLTHHGERVDLDNGAVE